MLGHERIRNKTKLYHISLFIEIDNALFDIDRHQANSLHDARTGDARVFISVLCASLADPIGGAISRTTDGINTRVNYTCQSGYTLSGASALTCGSDGSWDAQQPSCGKTLCVICNIKLKHVLTFLNVIMPASNSLLTVPRRWF